MLKRSQFDNKYSEQFSRTKRGIPGITLDRYINIYVYCIPYVYINAYIYTYIYDMCVCTCIYTYFYMKMLYFSRVTKVNAINKGLNSAGTTAYPFSKKN